MPKSLLSISAPARADVAVARALGISRARARELLEGGAVRLDGRRLRKGERVVAGSALEVARVDAPPVVPQPELPLHVLRESPAALVLDKPAGWPTHPLRPGEGGTLANALAARFPECLGASLEPREAGLCHRLDRETSGAILAARSREAFLDLRAQFRERTVQKTYLAIVRGRVEREEGRVERPLAEHGRVVRPWRSDRDGKPQPALTLFRTLGVSAELSLLEVRIETGARHQIRAHLAAVGHPLAGDAPYGGGAPLPPAPHQLLHAWRLGFREPGGGVHVEVLAPVPALFQEVLAAVGLQGLPRA